LKGNPQARADVGLPFLSIELNPLEAAWDPLPC